MAGTKMPCSRRRRDSSTAFLSSPTMSGMIAFGRRWLRKGPAQGWAATGVIAFFADAFLPLAFSSRGGCAFSVARVPPGEKLAEGGTPPLLASEDDRATSLDTSAGLPCASHVL